VGALVEQVGKGLATGVGVYCLLLAAGVCLLVHWLALGLYVWAIRHPRPGKLPLGIECTYGLLNPLVYLLVLEPALFRHARAAWLSSAGLALLGAYWVLRLLGGVAGASPSGPAKWIRASTVAGCALAVIAFAVRDARYASNSFGSFAVLALLAAPLYGIALIAAGHQLRRTFGSAHVRGDEFNLFRPRALRAARRMAAAATVGVVAMASFRDSSAAIHDELVQMRPQIREASRRHGVDPRLLASIVEVAQSEESTPLHSSMERLASLLLADPLAADVFASLEPSIGVAQVKPKTAMAALAMCAGPSEEKRTSLTGGWAQLSASLLCPHASPAPADATRKDVIKRLLATEGNLEFCAFILSLYQNQWKSTQGAIDIEKRPDILATLYSLGFERSQPKAFPEPNAFGRTVRRVYEGEWMQEQFGDSAREGQDGRH
jgi:hypothetical protein